MKIRFIGDLHGGYSNYKTLVEDANAQGMHTIQVGDFGFQYDSISKYLESCSKTYGMKNNCILGNHDWYSRRPDFDLGDYGFLPYNSSVYFIRGAFSIDWRYQLNRGTWFKEEELTRVEAEKCLKHVKKHAHSIKYIFTHDAPRTLAAQIGKPDVLRNFGYNPDTFTTVTSELLEEVFNTVQPKYWVHGHFHRDYTKVINGTTFIGLGIESYVDIDVGN